MMAGFSSDRLHTSTGSTAYHRVERELAYSTALFDILLVTIPVGFETDFGSIPWWLQWGIKKHGRHNLPSALHDYLLATRKESGLTRRQCAKVFDESLGVMGMSRRMRWSMYQGVRLYDRWKAITG